MKKSFNILRVIEFVIGFALFRFFVSYVLNKLLGRWLFLVIIIIISFIISIIIFSCILLFTDLLESKLRNKKLKIIIGINLILLLLIGLGIIITGIVPIRFGVLYPNDYLCYKICNVDVKMCEKKSIYVDCPNICVYRCFDKRPCMKRCKENNKSSNCELLCEPPIAAKPIIYLYPTSETKVHVKLGTPENLSHTYPKYNFEKGWNVIAQPSGDLEDIETGRKLYALYREGKSEIETNFDEGFVVAGKDTIPFLEEKLAILGLNEREAEEFIVYWLPQMEDNKWNLVRFESIEEQNENMPLNITPKPDTVIRVMMDWKSIDEPINIPEQQLITPERNGFTVVEWGGSPHT